MFERSARAALQGSSESGSLLTYSLLSHRGRHMTCLAKAFPTPAVGEEMTNLVMVRGWIRMGIKWRGDGGVFNRRLLNRRLYSPGLKKVWTLIIIIKFIYIAPAHTRLLQAHYKMS